MLPKIHAIVGAAVSILIFFIFHITFFEAFLILFASIFIDFDHYLWYLIKNKDWKLKNSYQSFKEKRLLWNNLSKKEKKEHKMPIFIFHVIEFWIILILLSFISKYFIYVLLGVLIHMILDYLETIYTKSLFYPKLSLIFTYLKNKKRERHFY